MQLPTARQVVVAAVAALVTLATPAAADPAPGFAPAESAAVTPGVEMVTPVGGDAAASCTAAFVFTGRDALYLGYAAHCAARRPEPSRSGCEEPTLPLGSPVTVVGRDGSETAGQLAYSSWRTMQQRGETDADLCSLNDFALVRLDPAAVSRVNPSVPYIGGPTTLDVDGTRPGEPVFSYQPNNPGTALKRGRSLGDDDLGRSHRVRTTPPGSPGDSGSGYLDGDGHAFGILSTLYLDASATNGVTDLAEALAYADAYGGLGRISLVEGTEPFGVRD